MNLLKDIQDKKITYKEFADKFLAILEKSKKQPLSKEDFDFLKASLEVLKVDPKTLI